ncbi:MAG: malectin domain-containing carbohydrate-binding protein, partial [Rhodothermales bacterium]
MTLNGPDRSRWSIENPPQLPLSIAPGSSVDLTIRFITESARRVHAAMLTISSDDPVNPNLDISLGGYWQNVSEGDKEPTFQQIIEVLGYTTTLVGDEQDLNTRGKITATGDEIISAYWRQADVAQPVKVRQVAAWHTYPEAHRIFWHAKGSFSANVIFRQEAEDSQTILPRRINSALPAEGSFMPSAVEADGVFGFRIQSNEWSDPARNDSSNDDCSGGLDTCGQHVRFWPAKDRQGTVMPNTYIMAMDFAGINYDYQDNVYLVSNVTPSSPVAGLQDIRINAGGPLVTTSDVTYLADIYSSGGGSYTPKCDLGDIAGTEDDELYRTEYSDGNPFHYAIPAIAGVYNIRLHFAEIAHGNCSGSEGGEGKRVFDVWLEGMKVLENFDITAEVPPVTALIKEFQVGIADGILNLDFLAAVDFPMISAIEVIATDNMLPVASFSATPMSGYAPLDVSFDASASTDDGAISSYSWNFGDGTAGTGVITSHTYSSPGAYAVTLTLQDDEGAWKSSSKTITVGQAGATSDLSEATWSQVSPQPVKNAEGQGAVVGGKLYSFGGFDSQKSCCTPTKRSYVYDPGANTWTAIADLPHANGGGATHHGVTTDGTNIYIAGGYIADATGTAQIFGTREVYGYNLATNTYSPLPELPVERAGGGLEYF